MPTMNIPKSAKEMKANADKLARKIQGTTRSYAQRIKHRR